MSALHALVDSYLVALTRCDEDTGEVPDDVGVVLDTLAGSLSEKVEALAAVRLRYHADAAACNDLAKRYAEKCDAHLKQAARIDRYVLEQLQRAGIPRVNGATHRVWLAKSQRVLVTCAPEDLPEAYQRKVPAKVEADKKALGDALKRGETIVDVELETTESVRFA